MVKVCQTCGDKGFIKGMIYCTSCWDTVEHIYCLGLSPDKIGKGFRWTCDSCSAKDKQMVGIVMYGAEVDKDVKSCHLSPILEEPSIGIPVVGPIWRGRIEITGSLNKKLDGLEVFMRKTPYSKVVRVTRSLEPSLCFSMKNRHVLWPKHFDELGAGQDEIDLFIFPEIARSETDYEDLVELMIANDLAMSLRIGTSRLIIFTSLEQKDNQQQIQGKYYLWGILKCKKSQRCKSSKGIMTSAEKERIYKCVGELDCPEKQNISPNVPAERCDLLPSLSEACKKSRSKMRRVLSPNVNKEGNVYIVVEAEFSGKEREDQQSNGVDNASKAAQNSSINENKEAVQRSCDSDMEIDEDVSTVAQNCIVNETKEVEQRSWDSDMEID